MKLWLSMLIVSANMLFSGERDRLISQNQNYQPYTTTSPYYYGRPVVPPSAPPLPHGEERQVSPSGGPGNTDYQDVPSSYYSIPTQAPIGYYSPDVNHGVPYYSYNTTEQVPVYIEVAPPTIPWWNLLAILCCVPLGLISACYLCMATRDNREGRYARAKRRVKRSNCLSRWAVFTGIATLVVVFILLHVLSVM